MNKIEYIIGRNDKFWKAIHQLNSSPLWNCIIDLSRPLNPRNRRSKLIVRVVNDPLFKVIATASGLKYLKYETNENL